METWMLFALISALVWWFYSFTFKIIAQRHYDTYISTSLSYLVGTAMSIVLVLYNGISISWEGVFFLLTILGFWNILFYTASIMTRVESMRNIDSVIFFPLYKTFGPIMVTGISLFIFQETLSTNEVLGIIVGIMVPLMLITKTENRIQKNLLRWVMLVVLTAVLTSVSAVIPKYVQLQNLDINYFIFASFFFWTIISFIWYIAHKRKGNTTYKKKGMVLFSLLAWVLHFFAFYTFMRAMEGNLAIAFTINSFSILIPIILSIIFYWEHFNLKKGIVIALSIVSILLFI